LPTHHFSCFGCFSKLEFFIGFATRYEIFAAIDLILKIYFEQNPDWLKRKRLSQLRNSLKVYKYRNVRS